MLACRPMRHFHTAWSWCLPVCVSRPQAQRIYVPARSGPFACSVWGVTLCIGQQFCCGCPQWWHSALPWLVVGLWELRLGSQFRYRLVCTGDPRRCAHVGTGPGLAGIWPGSQVSRSWFHCRSGWELPIVIILINSRRASHLLFKTRHKEGLFISNVIINNQEGLFFIVKYKEGPFIMIHK